MAEMIGKCAVAERFPKIVAGPCFNPAPGHFFGMLTSV